VAIIHGDIVAVGSSAKVSARIGPGTAVVDPRTLAGLRLVVYRKPPSDTVHVLELRVDGAWSEATTFRSFTTTGDVLEWRPGHPIDGVEAFHVTTLESASWPEWYEFEIDTGS